MADESPKDPRSLAREIFGQRAQFYTTSAAHTDPQVLARVVELLRPQKQQRVLDVATGTGHTAFALAPHVAFVIGADLTPEMLDQARRKAAELGIANVEFQIADALALPFASASFDALTCRRAAHHFADIARALNEMRRVLKPGGRLVLDDRSVPEDDFADRALNYLDTLHDASHVRQYRPTEWRRMLAAAGFNVEVVEPYTRQRPISAFTEGVAPADAEKVHTFVRGLNLDERAKLNVAEIDGVTHVNHWYVMVAAVAEPPR